MEFSYQFIKKTLYLSMSALGAVLLAAAFIFMQLSSTSVEPVSLNISAGVLTLVGSMCLCFGIVTFLLRDDPDLWL